MAVKSKVAPKAPAKKAVSKAQEVIKKRKRTPKAPPKPVEVKTFTVEADQAQATLVINGKPHTLSLQDFLGVRRQFNDVAAGLVH